MPYASVPLVVLRGSPVEGGFQRVGCVAAARVGLPLSTLCDAVNAVLSAANMNGTGLRAQGRSS